MRPTFELLWYARWASGNGGSATGRGKETSACFRTLALSKRTSLAAACGRSSIISCARSDDPSQSRGAPQRLGFSLSKWRLVLRSLLKNRYRTTYQCYSFSETSSQDAFNAPIRASNRHHGGECDLGEGRHRLVGSTSMRSFSEVWSFGQGPLDVALSKRPLRPIVTRPVLRQRIFAICNTRDLGRSPTF